MALRVRISAVVVGCVVLASSNSASAAPRSRAIEVDAFGGLVKRSGPSVTDAVSTRNGGIAVAVTAAFRSPYFLAPFVDVGYYPIVASDRALDLGGQRAVVLNRLWAFGFVGGAAIDVWKLRGRFGVGAYDVVTSTDTPDAHSTVSELDFGYLASVTFHPLVRDRFRVGIEARAGLMVEAETRIVTLGATLGGDAITF